MLVPCHLDGSFSIRRYEEKRETFHLNATKFESGAIRFSGWKIAQNNDSSVVLVLLGTVNSELKIAQKTAFEAKGQRYTTGKVIQCLFNID